MQKIISLKYKIELRKSPYVLAPATTHPEHAQPPTLKSGKIVDCVRSNVWYEDPHINTAYLTVLESVESDPHSISNTEKSVLRSAFSEIYAQLNLSATEPVCVIDLGCGNGDKTTLFVEDILSKGHSATVVPIDINSKNVATALDKISVLGVDLLDAPEGIHVSDFFNFPHTLRRIQEQVNDKKIIVLFLGSTIGNFTPEESHSFLYSCVSHSVRIITGTSVLNRDPLLLDNLKKQYSSTAMILWLREIAQRTVFKIEPGTEWASKPNGTYGIRFNHKTSAIEAFFTFYNDCTVKLAHDSTIYLAKKGAKLLYFKSSKFDLSYYHSTFERLGMCDSGFILHTSCPPQTEALSQFQSLHLTQPQDTTELRQDHILFVTKPLSLPREISGIPTIAVAVILLEEALPFPEFKTQFQRLFSGAIAHYPVQFQPTLVTFSELRTRLNFQELLDTHTAVCISGGHGHPQDRSRGDLRLLNEMLPTMMERLPVIGFCMGMQLAGLTMGQTPHSLFPSMRQYISTSQSVDFNSLHISSDQLLHLYYCHQFGMFNSESDTDFVDHFSVPTPGGRSHFFQAHPETGEKRLRAVFTELSDESLKPILSSHQLIQDKLKESIALDVLRK